MYRYLDEAQGPRPPTHAPRYVSMKLSVALLLAASVPVSAFLASPARTFHTIGRHQDAVLQQHSGGPRQRHKMMGKRMSTLDKQRSTGGDATFTARPPPQAIAGGSPAKGSPKQLTAKAGSDSNQAARPPAIVAWHCDGNAVVDRATATRVEMVLRLRDQAKQAGDFERADELREVLRQERVDVFDNERVWRLRAAPSTMMCASGDEVAPAAVNVVAKMGSWFRASVLAGLLVCAPMVPTAARAALPPDTSGTWAITETRGGQKCTATLMLQPTRAPQSAEETRRGAARYQGVCVDSADGSWLVQEGAGAGAPRLAWRLEYEKSTVFFAFDVVESPRDGALVGKGDVYAAPRANPKGLAKVGGFEARRVSTEWDLRNPVVSKRVTDTALPSPSLLPASALKF